MTRGHLPNHGDVILERSPPGFLYEYSWNARERPVVPRPSTMTPMNPSSAMANCGERSAPANDLGTKNPCGPV